jgi:hypothetical protein
MQHGLSFPQYFTWMTGKYLGYRLLGIHSKSFAIANNRQMDGNLSDNIIV